ncbi:hypothetical protein Q5H91_11080 [Sphingomonas sp. KR1UV-12]|uniref:Uncharacterized protein n=1 Tax=Sphingomonas aurea TaxID=3063994 RepID=A0ABT9ELC2_9SPHN|nr:hypothetical protein [Sphingomonas sp. KR1UV-12]MDP1027759.1 hypothetical protein [Sphingomonas sp. KR1UV-12]
MFESTERRLLRQFKPDDEPDFDRLRAFPCLFMVEGTGDQLARVGELVVARIRGGQATLEYRLDDRIRPIRNRDILAVREEFGIDDAFEFSRNHWAIKDVDLFQAMLRLGARARQRPQVFTLDEVETIDPDLVSVMMPFDAGFDSTYRGDPPGGGGGGVPLSACRRDLGTCRGDRGRGVVDRPIQRRDLRLHRSERERLL